MIGILVGNGGTVVAGAVMIPLFRVGRSNQVSTVTVKGTGSRLTCEFVPELL